MPSLNDILGQDAAIAQLRAAVVSERVHHAWVFSGPAGVGKFTTALAFAAMLLDPTTGPTLTGEIAPQDDSEVQRLVAAGTHPDLHVITKELAAFSDSKQVRDQKQTTIAKEVIDEHLLTPIALAPTMKSHGVASKIFIVDEAELMDRSRTYAPTQNALLKTLEEPPAGSVIILVTAAEEMLLPTIRSRCQRVVFRALDDRAMGQWLKRAGVELDKHEHAWIERFASGSPGKAKLAHETGLYRWAQALEPLLTEAESGRYRVDLGPTMAKLVDDWAAEWVKERPQASKEAANHAGSRHLFSLLSERERDRLRAAANDFEAAERIARRIELIHDAENWVRANVQLGVAMEGLSVELART